MGVQLLELVLLLGLFSLVDSNREHSVTGEDTVGMKCTSL